MTWASAGLWGMGFADLAVWVVVIAAVVCLASIALRRFGVKIPGWLVEVFWVVVAAVVIIIAIRLVAGV